MKIVEFLIFSLVFVCCSEEKSSEALSNGIKCYNGDAVRRTFCDKQTNAALDHPYLSMIVLTQYGGFEIIDSQFRQESRFI